MFYTLILTMHLISVIIYGGFLITDTLFLSKIEKAYGQYKYNEIRRSFVPYVRMVVPFALVTAGITGIYLFYINFDYTGILAGDYHLSNFQILLLLKVFLASWLLLRGIRQRFFGKPPMMFKGHTFPAIVVVLIVILAKFMRVM